MMLFHYFNSMPLFIQIPKYPDTNLMIQILMILFKYFEKIETTFFLSSFLFRHLLKMKLEYLIYSVKHFVNIYERLCMLLLVDNYFWLVLERKNKHTFFVSFWILLFYVITVCSSSDLRVFTIHTQVNVHHGSYECSCWRA